MPRPPKRGLDYFGKDVDFYEDFKIIDLLSEHGPVGVVIYDFLLTQIYKNGYYLELPIDKEDKEAKYKLLAEYGETIYKSITAGNPDAVWVTQGWTFGYQHYDESVRSRFG